MKPNYMDKTTGLIIIGDEILKGQVMDTNSYFICQNAYQMGLKLAKICVVGDSIQEIAAQVKEFSCKFDLVLTTGGTGPTHDDNTYVGVANAFEEGTERNEDMFRLVCKWMGEKIVCNEVMDKMTALPHGAKLLMEKDAETNQKSKCPIINVRNVFIFPGIPKLLEEIFPLMNSVLQKYFGDDMAAISNNAFHAVPHREIIINCDEMKLAPILNTVVKEFKDVTFGSYTGAETTYSTTKITLESKSEDEIDNAIIFLKNILPTDLTVKSDY